MTSPSHHTPTPFEDPLREAVELAKRINRRLSERFQPPAPNPAEQTDADDPSGPGPDDASPDRASEV